MAARAIRCGRSRRVYLDSSGQPAGLKPDRLPGLSDHYVYVWSFEVAADKADEFRRLYGPNGAWSQLFASADGYIDTQLLEDRGKPGRFMTIDRWESEDAFRAFRSARAQEFQRLDRMGDVMTLSETLVGEFRACH